MIYRTTHANPLHKDVTGDGQFMSIYNILFKMTKSKSYQPVSDVYF